MANILLHTAQEPVTMSAQAANALLEKGDGDAALLYLALLRHHGAVPPRSLAGELRWERSRIEAAERSLRELRLIAGPAENLPEQPAEEKPEYRREDVAQRLESSADFRGLVAEVEKTLGKKLTTPDVALLLELQDYVGLPADVIYLLVCHCVERTQRRLGQGRRPTVRQICREGYIWAHKGLDSQAAAAEYLKQYAARQGLLPQYMRALGLGDRSPVASEEKYLSAWCDWGFSPEMVALACDRTVLKCHELKWPYCNGILKRWHEAGLRTVEDVQRQDGSFYASQQRQQGGRTAAAGGDSEMLQYLQQLHRGEG